METVHSHIVVILDIVSLVLTIRAELCLKQRNHIDTTHGVWGISYCAP